MKQKDIAALLDEPACAHNKKAKSGCAKPKPGATAGGCAFDGAQIALLPIAEIALSTMLISEGIYLSNELGREVTADEIKASSQSTAIEP
jgi:hypothetical protein